MNLGRTVEFQAQGKTWRTAKMEYSILDRFAEWVKTQLADPFAGLEKIIDKLPREDALQLVREAQARQREMETLDIDSPEVSRFMKTNRGAMRIFHLLLSANHPELTLDQAFALGMELGEDKIQEIFGDAAGEAPGEAPQGNRPGPAA